MAKKAMRSGRINAAQLATEACDQGFQDGVRKMVEILLQGWVIAQTPNELCAGRGEDISRSAAWS